MNLLASLLLLGLGALPINTVFEDEVVVITSEDLDRKRSPVFFAVHRLGGTGFSIDLALTPSSRMAPDLGPFQLCVLSQPVSLANLPGTLAHANLILRTESVRKDRATFDLRNEEVPHSALLIYLVTRAQTDSRTIRGFCLPLPELMKAARIADRRPLNETGSPPAA